MDTVLGCSTAWCGECIQYPFTAHRTRWFMRPSIIGVCTRRERSDGGCSLRMPGDVYFVVFFLFLLLPFTPRFEAVRGLSPIALCVSVNAWIPDVSCLHGGNIKYTKWGIGADCFMCGTVFIQRKSKRRFKQAIRIKLERWMETATPGCRP